MRISDWSSDVCSSDLFQPDRRTDKIALGDVEVMGELAKVRVLTRTYIDRPHHHIFCHENLLQLRNPMSNIYTYICQRSEEHTSELQSLMRISYAVFCLKKKINTIHHTT